jgi:hypothetical protein
MDIIPYLIGYSKQNEEQARRPAPCFRMRFMLPLHIDDRLQHLVTYGDDLGVGLEAAFGDYARTWDAGLSATPR